jgi:hypothetical protein
MGTIIAYEVLSALPENQKVDTFITIGSPLGLPVVKSRIVAGLKEYRPDKTLLSVPGSVVKAWVNLADIEDNVALNYKLADDFLPNQFGVGITDTQVTNDYIFNNHKNPHKAYGYLRTPELTSVIHDFLPPVPEMQIQKIVGNLTRIFKVRKPRESRGSYH